MTFAMAALASGMTPKDRSVASNTNPSTNHGTSAARSIVAFPRDRRFHREKNTTTGPSMSTRASLTTVATCPLSALTANAAANTCGTA